MEWSTGYHIPREDDTVARRPGAVIALVLAIGGAYVYVSDIRTDHAMCAAAWNAPGIVVLVMAGSSAMVTLPTVVAVGVLGVSAVAHVLIGVNHVRRVRARGVATATAARSTESPDSTRPSKRRGDVDRAGRPPRGGTDGNRRR